MLKNNSTGIPLSSGLNAILPSNVVDLTSSIIIEVVEHQSGSILGVSAVLTVWSASSAFRAVIKGVNKAYNITRTTLKTYKRFGTHDYHSLQEQYTTSNITFGNQEEVIICITTI